MQNITEEFILYWILLADYITGVCVAFLDKQLNSSIGIKGIFQKIGIIVCVFLCALIDKLHLINTAITPLVICFFVINESLSILENLAKLNVPLPQFLLQSLKDLKNKVNK